MPIRILPTEVSSKIAAGEVIERPSSIVKELVENSIDAGASQIVIEARGGGIKYIRVSDNGAGIAASDLQYIFHRYATSKISASSDLEAIQTLGFRGEALHSVAAVSEVEITTCTHNEENGSFLLLKNGLVTGRGSRGCPQGTIITVRELFRQVPARLKFLKSTATENEHILDIILHSSLSFPEIRFTLFLDDHAVWRTSGNGNLRDILVTQYNLEIARAMLDIKDTNKKQGELSATPVITGLISPPEITRANRKHMNFFVNRRSIRSALLTRAVEEGYHGFLMTGHYPLVFLNITLPPEIIDVNVHPTKKEIRFSNESAIFSAVQGIIKKVLLDSGQVKVPDISQHSDWKTTTEEQEQITITTKPSGITLPLETSPDNTASQAIPILRVIGQIANCYIIAESNDGLYLIDQHAAHERIIYEKIIKERRQKKVEMQSLLEPAILELNTQQEIALQKYKETLSLFGFILDHFGGRSYLIRAIPATLQQKETSQVVLEILDSIDGYASLQKRDEQIAISIACHGVIRAGQGLDPEEMKNLIRQLEQTSMPRTCPHGRPTMIHLSSSQLAKEFGRSAF